MPYEKHKYIIFMYIICIYLTEHKCLLFCNTFRLNVCHPDNKLKSASLCRLFNSKYVYCFYLKRLIDSNVITRLHDLDYVESTTETLLHHIHSNTYNHFGWHFMSGETDTFGRLDWKCSSIIDRDYLTML